MQVCKWKLLGRCRQNRVEFERGNIICRSASTKDTKEDKKEISWRNLTCIWENFQKEKAMFPLVKGRCWLSLSKQYKIIDKASHKSTVFFYGGSSALGSVLNRDAQDVIFHHIFNIKVNFLLFNVDTTVTLLGLVILLVSSGVHPPTPSVLGYGCKQKH